MSTAVEHGPGRPSRRRTSRWARAAVGLGVLAVVGGVVVLLARGTHRAGPAWFAYAPPPPGQLDGLVALDLPRVVGAGLVVAGLALVVVATGFVRGSRPREASSRPLAGVAVVGALTAVLGLVGLARPRRFVTLGAVVLPDVALTSGQVAYAALAVLGLLAVLHCAGVALGRRRG